MLVGVLAEIFSRTEFCADDINKTNDIRLVAFSGTDDRNGFTHTGRKHIFRPCFNRLVPVDYCPRIADIPAFAYKNTFHNKFPFPLNVGVNIWHPSIPTGRNLWALAGVKLSTIPPMGISAVNDIEGDDINIFAFRIDGAGVRTYRRNVKHMGTVTVS